MNSIQLASVICLGVCASPNAIWAFPLEEQDKVQVIAVPDYPVPSSPLEEVCYTSQKTVTSRYIQHPVLSIRENSWP